MTRVFMFPGQGTQRPGMGRALLDRYPDRVAEADELLGRSVRTLCLDTPAEELSRTELTQPAVYVVNALAYRAVREEAPEPDVAIGHSLGEYNALHAAGVFGFAEGLRLVLARARAMARITDGGMAAVVGMDEAVIRLLLRRAGLEAVEVANHNTADQTIIAGPLAKLETARSMLQASGAKAVRRLEVSGPFHTRHMTPAADEFRPAATGAALRAPRFPVIANRTALPYPAAGTAEVLTEQIDHPVLWRQTVEGLLAADPAADFHEMGDSQVLTRLLKAVRSEGAKK
ncbi:ACP S-malonyltransferase [Streptomyces sp. NPDC003038]|uniref:ACP S-malonyltransferase n=1 Tax=unclassified Streptomyces TaxID=2593676 RepID=UPI0033B07859